MVSQPAYLKNLKTFMRAQLGTGTDPKLMVQNVDGESDRGAVILSATSIEDMLEWAITARMPGLLKDSSARDSFFGLNGPVGSFSNKIEVAYAMGFVGSDLKKTIDLIREMRNACAHARQAISFGTPELRDVCKVVVAEVIPHMVDSNDAGNLRFCFTLKCIMICRELAGGEPGDMAAEIRRAIKGRDEP